MNSKIGILGGGQLGRMLYEALTPWDIDIHFLDQSRSFPVGKISPNLQLGDFNNYEDVIKFGKDKDVLSIEIENVNTDALLELQSTGVKCYPQPEIIAIIKDKGLQKKYYSDKGLPTASYLLVDNKSDILSALNEGKVSLPFIQKARTAGYDGRGVQLIGVGDLKNLWDIPSVIEDLVNIDKEISVIIARNAMGQVELFPPVEMVVNPDTNQLDFQICPANIDQVKISKMEDIATRLINSWQMIGLLAIEFFVDKNGDIFINEVAPRPHNSGHHSIEGCNVSQFEQLGRVLLGLDLIKPKITLPSVMLNLVGSNGFTGPAQYVGLEDCLNMPNAFVHLYGKETTKPNRKMGHVTFLDNEIERAVIRANSTKQKLKIISD